MDVFCPRGCCYISHVSIYHRPNLEHLKPDSLLQNRSDNHLLVQAIAPLFLRFEDRVVRKPGASILRRCISRPLYSRWGASAPYWQMPYSIIYLNRSLSWWSAFSGGHIASQSICMETYSRAPLVLSWGNTLLPGIIQMYERASIMLNYFDINLIW